MPYKLTKQEKAVIKRQYLENIRIFNSYLPENLRIRANLKELNRKMNDPKEVRFYKKSLEINRVEAKKLQISGALKLKYEEPLRMKNRPDPLERLMHCEMAPSDTPEAQAYNDAKMQNYYRHPEAETQRRFQNLLKIDMEPLAKTANSPDVKNFMLDFYEDHQTEIQDAYCFVRSLGWFKKDQLTPEMQQYGEAIAINNEVLVSVNDKIAAVKENYYFSMPELNEDQIEALTVAGDLHLQHEQLSESFKSRYVSGTTAVIAQREYQDFFRISNELGVNASEKGILGKVVGEDNNGNIIPYTNITRKHYQENNVPHPKVLNEQEVAGVYKMFNKDYTKEEGYQDLKLPEQFQPSAADKARKEFIFNYAIDHNQTLTEVDEKGLGGIAESITGNWKEKLLRTTSRQYKNFIKAAKEFENPQKINGYKNNGRVASAANAYLIHKGVRTEEQAMALPEPGRSRALLCLNTMNTFQKHMGPNELKYVPGTNELQKAEEPKKSTWPPAIEDEKVLNDQIEDEKVIDEPKVEAKKENVIEEEEINTNEIHND